MTQETSANFGKTLGGFINLNMLIIKCLCRRGDRDAVGLNEAFETKQ